jgi:hypothetical protein
VAVPAAAAFLAPVVSLSWLALSGLAAYLVLWGGPCLHLRKAAAVMLAMTIPMLWSRLLFTAFSGPILAADAFLVSRIVGTESIGNTVELADGSGWVFIAPACSSLTNVSIAILCAVVFVTMSCRGWTLRSLLVATLACGATVLINVLRMGAVGLHPDLYPQVHGATGNMLAGWFTLATILGICVIGIRPDAPRSR